MNFAAALPLCVRARDPTTGEHLQKNKKIKFKVFLFLHYLITLIGFGGLFFDRASFDFEVQNLRFASMSNDEETEEVGVVCVVVAVVVVVTPFTIDSVLSNVVFAPVFVLVVVDFPGVVDVALAVVVVVVVSVGLVAAVVNEIQSLDRLVRRLRNEIRCAGDVLDKGEEDFLKLLFCAIFVVLIADVVVVERGLKEVVLG